MLVLSRKFGEEIVIGSDIKIEVIEIRGKKVRLGITAPQQVSVLRAEILSGDQLEGLSNELKQTIKNLS